MRSICSSFRKRVNPMSWMRSNKSSYHPIHSRLGQTICSGM
ncbi:Uncharacterised protein [Vibrio cholerae]|nr:Uncharacterised protein [Vibrio cholerae]